jgi:hypothetical protein
MAPDATVVIVATTLGGERLTSRPMPKVVAEMLLALWVRRGIARVELRRAR